MNKKTPYAGFTLIELLVVISIISLLSGVVLSSVNSARAKASDTAVKAALKQVYTQAEHYRVDNPGYGTGAQGATDTTSCTAGVFSDSRMAEIKNNILSNAASGATFSCATGSSGQKWAMMVSPLKSGASTSWCVDNSGNFKATSAVTGGVCQ